MNVSRSETMHHTPEQVNGYIEQALVLLDAHELTADERARLLPMIVDKLSNKSIHLEQVVPAGMVIPGNARH